MFRLIKSFYLFLSKFKSVPCCLCGRFLLAFNPGDDEEYVCRDCTKNSRF